MTKKEIQILTNLKEKLYIKAANCAKHALADGWSAETRADYKAKAYAYSSSAQAISEILFDGEFRNF